PQDWVVSPAEALRWASARDRPHGTVQTGRFRPRPTGPGTMRRTLRLCLLLLFAAPATALAQWTFVGEAVPIATDFAIRDGVIVVACDGTSCGSGQAVWVSNDGGASWSNPLGDRRARAVGATP